MEPAAGRAHGIRRTVARRPDARQRAGHDHGAPDGDHGIRQNNGVYTFSGTLTTPEAGVQVTIARLDGQTGRVTGVASPRTSAAGRYEIRTALPAGSTATTR